MEADHLMKASCGNTGGKGEGNGAYWSADRQSPKFSSGSGGGIQSNRCNTVLVLFIKYQKTIITVKRLKPAHQMNMISFNELTIIIDEQCNIH